MPTIENINGIKINVYHGEHRPPHIHAVYNEFEILVIIVDLEIYAGDMPGKQLKSVREWLSDNANWVLKVFFELNPHLK